ncbi:MAG: ribosome assembly RNA-binding protein YhbY [Zetaproteobacteria bacterium CG12_big_fil_rev_8_21_14_0_65_55_1124]|nr:MAG: ribosome assembly protein YhbY [Zetaproteobacteria bacterium CG1_02_55_237]PIS18551.1 MAG: ribosome assembly RNA-binding protein YhbY [Zetaproteobacteria bacterium CG08_land_8_20_14_0_20_55_17]PIW42027.1 MAG: ribosome assembly RNA-binding protein YhbY [Zetaproteobacteria bacterium CG12_big_fil_rev_8_21_14_0_65_55_1124]PIY53933.1 MAG: ribosome assembly RNA-binding protein YhbY [Zetaproteobacteria bacterium CG_4_10_14_0_8_um_filter_55_43]PIZ39378.1 MAG: ribosome assembly RNA-binding prote
MPLDSAQKKKLKQAAHHLKPLIRVGQKGMTDSLVTETDACIERHELIKVHVAAGERDERSALATELATKIGADLVHSIGKVFILYRKKKDEA